MRWPPRWRPGRRTADRLPPGGRRTQRRFDPLERAIDLVHAHGGWAHVDGAPSGCRQRPLRGRCGTSPPAKSARGLLGHQRAQGTSTSPPTAGSPWSPTPPALPEAGDPRRLPHPGQAAPDPIPAGAPDYPRRPGALAVWAALHWLDRGPGSRTWSRARSTGAPGVHRAALDALNGITAGQPRQLDPGSTSPSTAATSDPGKITRPLLARGDGLDGALGVAGAGGPADLGLQLAHGGRRRQSHPRCRVPGARARCGPSIQQTAIGRSESRFKQSASFDAAEVVRGDRDDRA